MPKQTITVTDESKLKPEMQRIIAVARRGKSADGLQRVVRDMETGEQVDA